ncbi:MAG: hypothetical protein A2Z71_01450 [Chloroflexi bacterium RBG_13_50_21]|nr:MAG: hypothetical protein A2Z71_01450 [Chloroflexi bacterium RBG_13_50_21]
MKQFFRYICGVIAHPRATFDELGRLSSIRPAVMLVIFTLSLAYLNFLLTTLSGSDWLGTRRELADPTYVGFFGHLPVGQDQWVPIWFAIFPILSLLGLAAMPGLAHVLSKLWRGNGTFEGTVNALTFASVPAILIGTGSELLFTVPANLISGHPYWWAAAMNGEFGSAMATIWNFYVIGIYTISSDILTIVLGAVAIRRVQGIPWWAAGLVSLFGHVLWVYGIMATFVR